MKRRSASASAVVLACFAFSLGAAPRAVAAQDKPAGIVPPVPGEPNPLLRFEPDYRRVDVLDYLLTGVSAASLLITTASGPDEARPRRGGILFDEDVREALFVRTQRGRELTRDMSDVLLTFMSAYPILIDAALVSAWLERSPDVAIQLTLMDVEVLIVTAALEAAANMLASRERPYGRTCGSELSDDARDCYEDNRYESFFSGHASQTFAAAAVTCTHHLNLPLYGEGPENLSPCYAGFFLAAATAFLRVAGDEHYISDVTIGALIGTTVGFALPELLHYGAGGVSIDDAPGSTDEAIPTFGMTLMPMPNGIGVFGIF